MKDSTLHVYWLSEYKFIFFWLTYIPICVVFLGGVGYYCYWSTVFYNVVLISGV